MLNRQKAGWQKCRHVPLLEIQNGRGRDADALHYGSAGRHLGFVEQEGSHFTLIPHLNRRHSSAFLPAMA